MKRWFVVTQLLVINWGLLIREKFVLPSFPMCFTLGAKIFLLFFISCYLLVLFLH